MTSIAGCAQSSSTNTIVSEDNLIGKIFQAETNHRTGKMKGGGFNEIMYCFLRFEKDSVEITHRQIYTSSIYGEVNKSEKSESKTYQWKLQNDEIVIENFNDYGQLIFKADQIIGKNRFGNDLIFNRMDTNILKTGIVELISWRILETEQLEYAKYTKINSRGDNHSEIEINFNHNDEAEYYNFEIKDIKTDGKITTAELADISVENFGTVYFDDRANGMIEINHENNQVKVEIWYSTHRNDAPHYAIIWKQ